MAYVMAMPSFRVAMAVLPCAVVLVGGGLAGCAAGAAERPAERSAATATRPSAPVEDALLIRQRLFEMLSDVGLTCGGIRTAFTHGHPALMLPTACFVDESGGLATDASPRIERIAAALGAVGGVRYQVGAYLPEDTPGAAAATSTQADVVRAALVDAGLAADRLLPSVGYGSEYDEGIYDGPATLAPGSPLVEIAVLPE